MTQYLYAKVNKLVNPTHIIVLEWHEFKNSLVREKFYEYYGKNIMFWENSLLEIIPHGDFNQEFELNTYGRTEFVRKTIY